MFASILAAVDPSEHGKGVMDYSLQVGSLFGSRVVGLSIVDSKKIEGPILRDYLSTVGLDPSMDYKTKVETFYQDTLGELLAGFGKKTRAAGLEYDFVLGKGVVHKQICDHGRSFDLVIMGKMGEHAECSSDVLGGSVQYVARVLKRPLLLTPKKHIPIASGVVAYDGSSHAKRALEFACDLGRRTNLNASVLVVADGDEKVDQVAEQARDILLAAGSPFDVVVRAGGIGETILSYIEEVETDLLIMGAYGHGRIHAWILGSTTEEVISRARIPVLLLHH